MGYQLERHFQIYFREIISYLTFQQRYVHDDRFTSGCLQYPSFRKSRFLQTLPWFYELGIKESNIFSWPE